MNLQYIKANNVYYKPQEAGIKKENGCSNCPVCLIKKLWFGLWQIDYFDLDYQYSSAGYYSPGDEDKPNQRLILYPSGIQEIRWNIDNSSTESLH